MFLRRRFGKLKRLMDRYKIDAYLEAKENNIFYIIGMKGSSYSMIFCKNIAYIFLPEMLLDQYQDALKKNRLDKEVIVVLISPNKNDFELSFQNLKEAIKYIKEKEKIKTVFLPFLNISFSLYSLLKNLIKMDDVSSLIDMMRMVKDEIEIQKISKACNESFLISQKIPDMLDFGKTEFDIAKQIDILSINACGDKAFDTIVSFGKNTAFPHYIPQKDVIYTESNIEVMADFGTKFEDYCSDITRFFGIQKSGNTKLKEVFKVVKNVQEKILDMVSPGIRAKDIDLKARDMFKKYNFDKYFIHSTGHGVGLDIHELPSINKNDETVLKKGMVITIEPGIYVPGVGGVRIEDTVLIKDKGCKVLTRGNSK